MIIFILLGLDIRGPLCNRENDPILKNRLQDLALLRDRMPGTSLEGLKMQSNIDIRMMLYQWIVL